MNVRDLPCWPPQWRAASAIAGRAAGGESGTLIDVRWNRQNRTATLTMEDDGERYSAVLHDEVTVLSGLYRLLGSYIGRPLAKIGSLALNSNR